MSDYVKNECYKCIHKRDVPGDAHIACSNPDFEMTGNSHGIRNGWFFYPLLFDPVWMTKKCNNFKEKTVFTLISKEEVENDRTKAVDYLA